MTVTKAQLETQLAELQDQLTRAEEQLAASDNALAETQEQLAAALVPSQPAELTEIEKRKQCASNTTVVLVRRCFPVTRRMALP